MVWNGAYRNIKEATQEKCDNLVKNNNDILGIKVHKTYVHIIYQNKSTKKYDIDYFVFRNDVGMYRDINWFDPMHIHRTPKNWINIIYDKLDDERKKYVDEYKDRVEKKKRIPKLSEILEKGKVYKIFDEYIATYSHKNNRTYLFLHDGKLTKFVGLKPEHVKELKSEIAWFNEKGI